MAGEKYYSVLLLEINKLIKVASEARAKGFDPEEKIEMIRAEKTSERVEEVTQIKGIGERIDFLFEEGKDKIEVAFLIGKELVMGEFGEYGVETATELALKTGLAIMTDCVTSSPLEGISNVKVKNNYDGTKYLAIYYLGPIRTAGGTEAGLSVVLADYLRQLLHLDRYKPTQEEIYRYVEESSVYKRAKGRLQYSVSQEELEKLISYLPVEVTGPPVEEKLEVTFYRDLERVETNGIRGGALIVLNEGILLKARKLLGIISDLKPKFFLKGWDWLEEFIKKETNSLQTDEFEPRYLEKLPGGRPVFALPNRVGGFRLRYGRARNTGFASVGLNPATMYLLEGFIATGTQIKTEKPGKAAIVTPVSSIEGPVVLLNNGSVKQVNTLQEAKLIKGEVRRILSLGDILISVGDFLENKHPFLPSGLCEEWWVQELEKSLKFRETKDLSISEKRIKSFTDKPLECFPTPEEAWELSNKLEIPLHPRYLFNWENVTLNEVSRLISYYKGSGVMESGKLKLKKNLDLINILQKLRTPYSENEEQILIEDKYSFILSLILDEMFKKAKQLKEIIKKKEDTLIFLSSTLGFPFYAKASTYIGARMGRPEKSRERKLKPPIHILFPLERYGDRYRSLNKAYRHGVCRLELHTRKCPTCGLITPYLRCDACGSKTYPLYWCPKCGEQLSTELCERCRVKAVTVKKISVNLSELVDLALNKIGIQSLDLIGQIKGVKGLMNEEKTPEHLIKGILRTKHGVYVNKDGTSRFDAVNAPLTHFKPREIGLTLEKARELGYKLDCKGKPLENDEQVCEIFYQDLILSKEAAKYLLKVSRYIDELLEKLYGLEPYYKAKNEQDLIGHVVFGISPHTFVAVAGRIIGFTDANVQYAHPVFHAAKRRNCDGDEDSIILGLDALINFSRKYVPSKVGGMEDIPLLFITKINLANVDDEVYNMEITSKLPLNFYYECLKGKISKETLGKVERVSDLVNGERKSILYTHETRSIGDAPAVSSYKKYKTMFDKVVAQMRLAEKIEAVSPDLVASLVIENHFIPDIVGNLRNFTYQGFRCVKCNSKYRRPPLQGRCICGGELIPNVPKGGVVKYVAIVQYLTSHYKVPRYLKQRFKLLLKELDMLFQGEEVQVSQMDLSKFL